MNRNVIRFVAFDEVLRIVLRSMVNIPFEASIREHFLDDRSTLSSSFGVPFNVVTAFERLRHLAVATEPKMYPAK